MRHFRNRTLFSTLFAASAMFIGGEAGADIIPTFDLRTPLGGGISEYTYNVSIASGSKVSTNDYFTIYDFNGYVPGSAFAPADWSVSAQLVGVTPPTQSVLEDAGVVNITFTYTGAATLVGPIYPVAGLHAFGADSYLTTELQLSAYASASHKDNPGHGDDGTTQENQGSVEVPSTPEASSLMLLSAGLVPLGMLLLRRRGRA